MATSTTTLSLPAAGQNVTVNIVPNEELKFAFDMTSALYVREDANLVITPQEGGSITLVDFFAVESKEALPEFVSEDGQRVLSADYLAALDIDISLAAGPAQRAATSGLGSYEDSAGNLLGGISRLGSQGTDQWGQELRATEQVLATPQVVAGDAGGGVNPTPDTSIDYSARAVLYTKDTYAGNNTAARSTDPAEYKLHINLVDANGNPVTVNPADVTLDMLVPKGAEQYFKITGISPNGEITLELTPAGLAALAAGVSLYNYLKVTINGVSYNIQLVADPNNTFNSPKEDDNANSGANLKDGELAFGEWHDGRGLESKDGKVNLLDTSGKGDRITFHDGLIAEGAGSVNRINTHTMSGKTGTVGIDAGINEAALTARNAGQNSIDGSRNGDGGAAQGATNVTLKGKAGMLVEGAGSQNTIANVSSVTIAGQEHGLFASAAGVNTITAVSGNVDVKGNIGLEASGASSQNTVTNVAGNVTITSGTTGMHSSDSAKNTVSGIGGDVIIQGGSYGLAADSKGTNEIQFVSNNVTISGGTDGLLATNGGINRITKVTGDVKISGDSSGMRAGKDAFNSINLFEGTGSASITSSNGAAMVATEKGCNSIYSVVENVHVTGKTAGMDAQNGGKNTISGVGKDAAVSGATGMYASGIASAGGTNKESINTISYVTGNLTVTGTDNYGMHVNETGKNTITGTAASVTGTNGNVTVSGAVQAMRAEGIIGKNGATVQDTAAENRIQDIKGNVTLNAVTMAMWASAGGSNIIERVAGDLTANGRMYADGGTNSVTGVKGSVYLNASTYTGGGLSAYNGGKNSVDTVGGNVTITGARTSDMGMMASKGGQNFLNKITGDVTITVAGAGMSAQENGSNAITNVYGAQGVTITAGSTNSGMRAFASGTNTISGVTKGNVTVSGYAGMQSSTGGTNTISGVAGNVNITGTTTAAMDMAGGANTISNVGGNVTLQGVTSGMSATSAGTNTIDDVRGTQGVSVTATGTNSSGLYTNSGTNTISNVTANVGVNSVQYGLYATGASSKNIIEKVGGNVTIKVVSAAPVGGVAAHGVFATAGASNTIQAAGTVSVSASSIANIAAAVEALGAGSMNTINGGNITLEATGTSATGVHTQAGTTGQATNSISATEKLSVTATATGASGNNVFGVLTEGRPDSSATTGKAETSLKAKTIDIKAEGNSGSNEVVGVSSRFIGASTASYPSYKYNSSHTTLEADSVKVGANRTAGTAAQQSGNWSGVTGSATGLEVQGFGGIDIKTSILDIYAAGSKAFGIRSFSNGGDPDGPYGANNTGKSYDFGVHITGTTGNDSFVIEAHSTAGAAMGVYSQDVSRVSFDGLGGNDTLSIKAHAHGNTVNSIAYGLMAGGTENSEGYIHSRASGGYQYGVNEVRNVENISIAASSVASSAYGMFASNATNANKITLDNGNLNLNIAANANTASGYGIGMAALGGAQNTVQSGAGNDKVSVSASNASGEAMGLYASNSISKYTAQNIINTGTGDDTVSITASGEKATGIYAEYGGRNSVTTDEVSITATGTGGSASSATAMYATGGGSLNELFANEVDITAKSASGSAFGLSALNGGINSINAVAGSNHGLEVRITVAAGQGQNAFAMFADGSGSINRITGAKDGGDNIRITGDIFADNGGKNIIHTEGAKGNLIELNGNVSKGGLTLETHGDHDVLVLRAGSVQEFNERFKDWLENLGNIADIEELNIMFSDPALQGKDINTIPELAWLAKLYADAHSLTQKEYDDNFATAEKFAAHSAAAKAAAAAAPMAFAPTSSMTNGTEHPLGNEPTATQPETHEASLATGTPEQAAPTTLTGENTVATAGQVEQQPAPHTAGFEQTATELEATTVAGVEHLDMLKDAVQPSDQNGALPENNDHLIPTLGQEELQKADATAEADQDSAVAAEAQDQQVTVEEILVDENDNTPLGAEQANAVPEFDSVLTTDHDLSGNDWSILDGLGHGALLVSDDGASTLKLNLTSAADLDNLSTLDLSSVEDVGSLWLSLSNAADDAVDSVFLSKAFEAIAGVKQVHLVVDQCDAVNLNADSGWERVESHAPAASSNYVACETYMRVEGEETLTLYIQSLS